MLNITQILGFYTFNCTICYSYIPPSGGQCLDACPAGYVYNKSLGKKHFLILKAVANSVIQGAKPARSKTLLIYARAVSRSQWACICTTTPALKLAPRICTPIPQLELANSATVHVIIAQLEPIKVARVVSQGSFCC